MGELKQFPDRFKRPEKEDEAKEVEPMKPDNVVSFGKKTKMPEKIEVGESRFETDLFLDILSNLAPDENGLREIFPTLDTEKYFELTATLPNLVNQGGRARANRLGADYEKVVHDYTSDELVSWVNDHSEGEWQQKPAWFMAIVNEIERRLDVD